MPKFWLSDSTKIQFHISNTIYTDVYVFSGRYILLHWDWVIVTLVIWFLTKCTDHHGWRTSFTLSRAFAIFHSKSANCFATESGRDNSCRERKPGECCEQKRILSCHCLDLHGQREDKLSGKLMLICIFHWLRFYNNDHIYSVGLMYVVCCTVGWSFHVNDMRGRVTYRLEMKCTYRFCYVWIRWWLWNGF